jgi:hypothetical protein
LVPHPRRWRSFPTTKPAKLRLFDSGVDISAAECVFVARCAGGFCQRFHPRQERACSSASCG